MIPSGYYHFCQRAGLNPHHPERWTPAEQATFRAWRLARFRAKWRWLRDSGDLALRVTNGERAQMLADVRADLDRALGPPLRRSPWRTCPCHRQRFYTPEITPSPEESVDDEDIAAWRGQDRAARQHLSRKLATALCYLDTHFKPKEPEHGHRLAPIHAGPPPGALRSYWPGENG